MDPSFDAGELMRSISGSGRWRGFGLQTDGSVILTVISATSGIKVIRLLPSGLEDVNFEQALSSADPRGQVSAIHVDAEDRVLVAGKLVTREGRKTSLVRLLKNGALDPSFQVASPSPLSWQAISGLVEDRSGRILFSGAYLGFDGGQSPAVFRLLPNGTLDPGFSSDLLSDPTVLGVIPSSQDVVVKLGGLLVLHGETTELIPPMILSRSSAAVGVLEGDELHLRTQVRADPYPKLQWLRDGTAIVGATHADFLLPSARIENAGLYALVATHSLGVRTQTIASVTVEATPQKAGYPARDFIAWC